jgi:hypothetical protein
LCGQCIFWRRKMIIKIVIAIILCLIPTVAFSSTINSASCSSSDVNTAIGNAQSGDTVTVPAGTCAWSTLVNINKQITLQGNGTSSTHISSGNVAIAAQNVTIKNLDLGATNVTVNATNFRITGNVFSGSGEMIAVNDGYYGVIDNNSFTSTSPGIEMIHVWGPIDSWTTDHSMGGADNVFIEDNAFSGAGGSSQCVQGSYNARIVFRYNNVSGMKFDMHGVQSNGYANDPAKRCDWSYAINHSARHCEVYANSFSIDTYWSMELRGGTGVIYNNTFSITGGGTSILLREYCTGYSDGNCKGGGVSQNYICPNDYPYYDQIGRGKNQGSEPMYLWNNTANGNSVVGFTGDTINPDHIQFGGMPAQAAETFCMDGGGGPLDGYAYSASWAYGNVSAIIKENRDYYVSSKPGYTPYTYPHPLRGSTPASTGAGSASFGTGGSMSIGTGGSIGF